ncbi:MAG: tetratricopeptide repeat protein [Acidobacteriota bacterium]|nr:tetratricopeptide repeat protein [Acidobacteriota bacterium]
MTRPVVAALSLAGLLLTGNVSSLQGQRPAERADSPARRLQKFREEERGRHPLAAREAGARLAEIARGFAGAGERARAIEILSEAAARDPDSGEILAELARLYLQNGDYEFASATLDASLERAELRLAAPDLYAAIGEGFASANRLEDAVAAWELAEKSGAGDAAIRARLERARRELSVTPGQRLVQSERFAVYSDATVAESVVAAAEAHLENEYTRQREFFGAEDLPGPQIVILYAGRRFFSLVAVPDWVSGVFDGKIRISFDPSAGFTPELRSVLSHELAHAWIRFLSRDHAPGWLHEGLAQWCEGRRFPRKDFHSVFARLTPFSLSEMEGNLGRRGDQVAARANYIEALGLVEYLAFTRGEGAVVCVLRALSDGASLEEALRREAAVTPAELVTRWRTWAGI